MKFVDIIKLVVKLGPQAREIFDELAALLGVISSDAPLEDKIRAVIPLLKLGARLTPNSVDDAAIAALERFTSTETFSDLVQLVIRLLENQPLMYASGAPTELDLTAELVADVIRAAQPYATAA